jgi:hypothetical protein
VIVVERGFQIFSPAIIEICSMAANEKGLSAVWVFEKLYFSFNSVAD